MSHPGARGRRRRAEIPIPGLPVDFGPEHVALLLGAGLGAAVDARTGRIPNAITLPMVALGIAIHTTGPTWWAGIAGAATAFAVHFPLWALRVEKGGDAKLMMGVGACLGWAGALEASLWLAIVYLPIGLVLLAVRGQLPNLLATVRHAAARAQGADAGPAPPPTSLRTGPILLVAAVLAWLTDVLPP